MLFRNILYHQEIGADKVGWVKNEAYQKGDVFIGITQKYSTTAYLTNNSPDQSIARAHVYTFVVDARTHKLVAHSDNRQSFSFKNVSKIPWMLETAEEAKYPQIITDEVWLCEVTENPDHTYTWNKVLDKDGKGIQVFVCKARHEDNLIGKHDVWNEEKQETEEQFIVSYGTVTDLEAAQA